jgi:hypothetical protein
MGSTTRNLAANSRGVSSIIYLGDGVHCLDYRPLDANRGRISRCAAGLSHRSPDRRPPIPRIAAPSSVRFGRTCPRGRSRRHRLRMASIARRASSRVARFGQHRVAKRSLSRVRRSYRDRGIRRWVGAAVDGSVRHEDRSDVRGGFVVAMPSATDLRRARDARRGGRSYPRRKSFRAASSHTAGTRRSGKIDLRVATEEGNNGIFAQQRRSVASKVRFCADEVRSDPRLMYKVHQRY